MNSSIWKTNPQLREETKLVMRRFKNIQKNLKNCKSKVSLLREQQLESEEQLKICQSSFILVENLLREKEKHLSDLIIQQKFWVDNNHNIPELDIDLNITNEEFETLSNNLDVFP